MKRIRIAIPTRGDKGLEDSVPDVFGKSKRFAILEIVDGPIIDIKTVDNPAASYKHGAGPIVVKMLADLGVTAVAAKEFGPGASALLEQKRIKRFIVKAGISVREAAQKIVSELGG